MTLLLVIVPILKLCVSTKALSLTFIYFLLDTTGALESSAQIMLVLHLQCIQ